MNRESIAYMVILTAMVIVCFLWWGSLAEKPEPTPVVEAEETTWLTVNRSGNWSYMCDTCGAEFKRKTNYCGKCGRKAR